jgi:hypothetical protein
MIYNFVKYLVQTQIRLGGLKFVIFISHKWIWFWKRYFTRLCIIISSTCVIFLLNLGNFFSWFARVFTEVVVYNRYVLNLKWIVDDLKLASKKIIIRKTHFGCLRDTTQIWVSSLLKTYLHKWFFLVLLLEKMSNGYWTFWL